MPRSPENYFPDLDRLPGIFAAYPDVLAVYLFGSVAAGTARPDSDLDLAVVPAGPAVHGQKLDMFADLAAAGFCRVDLVFLDTRNIVLKYEAVRHNRLIYSREDFDAASFFSLITRMYFDFQPTLKVQRDAYKRRILNGSA